MSWSLRSAHERRHDRAGARAGFEIAQLLVDRRPDTARRGWANPPRSGRARRGTSCSAAPVSRRGRSIPRLARCSICGVTSTLRRRIVGLHHGVAPAAGATRPAALQIASQTPAKCASPCCIGGSQMKPTNAAATTSAAVIATLVGEPRIAQRDDALARSSPRPDDDGRHGACRRREQMHDREAVIRRPSARPSGSATARTR